jgi:sulfoxide reductase heme-binding subunit YedZ
MTDPTLIPDGILWYAARGAGVASLLLLTGSVTLGALLGGGWRTAGWPRILTGRLHRNLSLLALTFLGLHVGTAVLDPYTALGPLAALIPFAVDYEPFWLGLGVVALDLALAVVATSLLRRHIGVRAWRAVHWLSYGAWTVAVVHGIGIGTDATTIWMELVVTGCVALVVGVTAWRALAEPPAPIMRPMTPEGAVAQPTRGVAARPEAS